MDLMRTKIRMDLLRRSHSPESLLARAIIRDLDDIEQYGDKFSNTVLETDGFISQKRLLDSFMNSKGWIASFKMERYSLLQDVLCFLLCSNREIQLDNLLSLCPQDERNERLDMLLTKIDTNIEILAMKEYGHCTSMEVFNALFRFTKLKKLELALISFENLEKICNYLKCLEHVDVTFASSHRKIDFKRVVESMGCFNHLRIFLFRGGDELERILYFLCIMKLPNIRIARHKFIFRGISKLTFERLPCLNGPSRLEHLCAHNPELEWATVFPHVTHLKVSFSYDNTKLDNFLNFPRLSGLHLVGFNSRQILLDFIDKYKDNLRELILDCDSVSLFWITIHDIFQSCKKLQSLELYNQRIVEDMSLPMPILGNLVTFVWAQGSRSNMFETLLTFILPSLPNLQTFVIKGTDFNAQDLVELGKLVVNGKILTKLKIFRYELFDSDSDGQYVTVADFKQKFLALRHFTMKATAYLPHLRDVEFILSAKLYEKTIAHDDLIRIFKEFDPYARRQHDDEIYARLGDPAFLEYLDECKL